jgi:hypothetical protein
MLNQEYYYLIAGLPDIILDDAKPAKDIKQFVADLEEQLSKHDFKLIPALFWFEDNDNLINLLFKEKKFSPLGNYSLDQLKEAIEDPSGLPDYMKKFLKEYDQNPDKSLSQQQLRLTELMLEQIISLNNGFLKDYYMFERIIRNTLTALMSRLMKRDYENELIGNEDWVISLKKSHALDFGLAKTNDIVDRILKIWHTNDLYKREKDLDHYRWEWIEQRNFFHYFDIDVILAYICKLKLAYRWMILDKEKGKEIFRNTVRKMETSFQDSQINTL